ncbi:30S ribosomal protein S17 [bacterium]|nr:30S ribosomal protein S17 [bacterium]
MEKSKGTKLNKAKDSKKIVVEKKEAKEIIRKRMDGVVLSDKNEKTLVVKVDRTRIHPKYKKRYTVSKKYKVHDEKGIFKEGDKVTFVQCRPLSKDKRWRVLYQ